MTNKEIAKKLTNGKIKVDELIIDKKSGLATANVMDAELDFIPCSFTNAGTITIHTEHLTYVEFTIENLINMIDLIEQSETHYNKI